MRIASPPNETRTRPGPAAKATRWNPGARLPGSLRRRLLPVVVALGSVLTIGAGPAGALGPSRWVDCLLNPAALQPAIASSLPGTTLHIRGRCVGNFTIDRHLTLVGEGSLAILDGKRSGTVVTVEAGVTAAFEHLKITHGRASVEESGGGMSVRGVARLYHTDVVGNEHTGGVDNFVAGGIYLAEETGRLTMHGGSVSLNVAGAPVSFGAGAGGLMLDIRARADLHGVVVSYNRLLDLNGGGGIRMTVEARLGLYGVQIVGNTSLAGGTAAAGLYTTTDGVVTMVDTTIAANVAEGLGNQAVGGWLMSTRARAIVKRSTITGNRAMGGNPGIGGIRMAANTELLAIATTIAGNHGDDVGGIRLVTDDSLTLIKSFVILNGADAGGTGGILKLDAGSTVTLLLSAVTLNQPTNCDGFAEPGCF